MQTKVYPPTAAPAATRDVTLLEVLDRVLEKGVVVAGDAVISVADVDLIYVGLRVLLSSVETMERLRSGGAELRSEEEGRIAGS